jgi:hypothetical protein
MRNICRSSISNFTAVDFRFLFGLRRLSVILYFFSLLLIEKNSFAQLSNKPLFTTKDYVQSIHAINDVMIHDVVGPTGASRYYAYVTMAGYEVISQQNPGEYPDLLPAFLR